jgi:thioredoxin-related protein
MKIKFLFFGLIFLSFITIEPPYKIGDKISNFTLVNAMDNASISLNDYASSKGVVLIFTSNDCPYAKLYEKRLMEIQKEYDAKEIRFLFVNSNNPQSSTADSKEEMQKKSYSFPYLIDSRQELANTFGAAKTPEAFVLKNINGNFVLQYKGAIDNNPQSAGDVSRFYLKDAINAIISNNTVRVSEYKATGCMIKK